MKTAGRKKRLDVHLAVRLPLALHTNLVMYAIRQRLTVSAALRRLLEISLKPSQRR